MRNLFLVKIIMVVTGLVLTGWTDGIKLHSVSCAAYPDRMGPDGKVLESYSARMMLDDNPESFACLLDDTPTGSDPQSRPANGSQPVTGLVLLDLGSPRNIIGMELLSRNNGSCFMPREIDVFTVDDPTKLSDPGKIVSIRKNEMVSSEIISGKGHVMLWEKQPLRYIGIKVHSSHTPVSGMHYNFQIAEIRLIALDDKGERIVLTGGKEQGLSMFPALASEVKRVEESRASEDYFAGGERRYIEQGLNATKPYPVTRMEKDWIYQDHGADYQSCFVDGKSNKTEHALAAKVILELRLAGVKTTAQEASMEKLVSDGSVGSSPEWKQLYFDLCRLRRQLRLSELRKRGSKIIFTKHYFLSGVVHYAWTEHITDQQYSERNVDYRMGASLNMLTIGENGSVEIEKLLDMPTGIIRDPNVSFDGSKIVFSMRRNDVDDDFHLYIMDAATRAVKQITFGLGVSDSEACFLPNGDLVFLSSRCIQNTDCWRQSVSNLYTCDAEGRFMRRLGFDQVHTNYPQVMDDGRVIYTRWEYNDRGQIFPQPLFVMNGDGTGQSEFYGGNSWFPTSILHARGIPGTQKVIAIASGHHTTQRGKLILVDRGKGTQEAVGIEYLAPRKPAEAVREDRFGWQGEQFQYPYAFDEQNYLVTYCPEGSPRSQNGPFPVPYGIYYMTEDGSRELLAYDPTIHCNQSVPLKARKMPPQKPSQVDYTKTMGTYYVQDVHTGQAMEGVPRGTVKSLRVVAIEYRAATAYFNSNIGEAGRSHSRTPPSVNNGSWDVKHVLGTVPVEADGSVYFQVPARTPLYFQLLDEKGYVVQTMRSWSTLQPGEAQACVGCHESKNESPPPTAAMAMRKGVRQLTPFSKFAAQYGTENPITDTTLTTQEAVKAYLTVNSPDGFNEPEGFSYQREIQPIWDAHCVKCHVGEETGDRSQESGDRSQGAVVRSQETGASPANPKKKPFSLKGDVLPYTYKQCPNNGDSSQNPHRAFSASYLNLTGFGHGGKIVNWISAQSRPSLLPPYFAGAAKSELMKHLEPEHKDVKVSDAEKRLVACWIDLCVPFCGSYTEASQWEKDMKATYLYFENKRAELAAIEIDNIRKYVEAKTTGRSFNLEDFQLFENGGPAAKKKFVEEWKE